MRRRGLTLIELLVAVLIMGVALAGLMGLWTFGFNTTARSADVALGYNIARREVERQHTVGYVLQPVSGTFTHHYDGEGAPAAEADARFVATTTVETLPDPGGTIKALRWIDVEVRAMNRGNEVVFSTRTYFVRGGV